MHKKKIIFCLSALLCALLCVTSASAAGIGSVRLENIGQSVQLYHVAMEDLQLMEPFRGAITFDAEKSPVSWENARILAEFAKDNHVSGWEKTAGASGEVFFTPLEDGMYLICSMAEEMEFTPFLVTIPMQINGQTVYHIAAAPKIEEPSQPTPPEPPVEPEPEIPQTGNSVWPRYILLAVGLVLCAAGVAELLLERRQDRA